MEDILKKESKIGIICAGDDELAPFLPYIENIKVSERAMLKIYEGTLSGISVAALYSGACKVNAALAAQILISEFGVRAVINAGVAGAMDGQLRIFDTVIAEKCAYHDVAEDILTDFHPWLESVYFYTDEYFLGLADRAAHRLGIEEHVFRGSIVTGEAFIDKDGRREIKERFAPLAVDMETAAIAHVCYVNEIPFIAVRTITDTEEESGEDVFESNCKKASVTAKDIVAAMLEELNIERRSMI